ncbi:MAG: GDSL-type esterase/lipase family protein [Gemmataceae bacterium]|nr:GDSL-type esterase/lipase family protein [Gemmata sp.]MDW8198242.1 GDSL-type esterase/lipase family protein [Gemmataceae bacterium]
MFRVPVVVVGAVVLGHPLMAQTPPSSSKPQVLLMGDSIRQGYAPLVTQKLETVAEVFSFPDNGGDTTTTLQQLETWIRDKHGPFAERPNVNSRPPLIVHFNCGLHDVKFTAATQKHQVPLEDYEKNLRAIVAKLRERTPHVYFATTTPILDERHAARKAGFARFNKDVERYNERAVQVMRELGVPVHDLNRIVQDGNPAELLGQDGTHYTPAGNVRLAEAVVDCLQRKLKLLTPTVRTAPASGPEAVKAYQQAEAAYDQLVPEVFKKMTVPEFPVPANPAEWNQRRAEVKKKVVAALGDLPPRPEKPRVHRVSVELHPGFRLERLRLDNGVDGVLSALLLIPEPLKAPAPAILWLHSSSYDHHQLLQPNTNGGEEPLGITFLKRGWVVFAPDAAWYGDRVGQGPAGSRETGREQQDSLHKYNLWFGRTLWGMFVRDDQVALDYLTSRPEVDPKRIGATGISMGSTRSWWLAAVDDRIACVVGVACLTRYENLLKHGQLRQHGTYYYVYGLLKHFDTEAVVSLIAPRPVLFLTGELDAGSPADGIKVIETKAGGVYQALGAAEKFRSIRYPDVGHTYTPTMRKEMLAWFDRWLK